MPKTKALKKSPMTSGKRTPKTSRVTNPPEVAKKLILEALENNRGLVYISCRQAHVCPDTYYRFLDEDPEFKEKVKEIREFRVDRSEQMLFDKIDGGDLTATIFHLKCQAKSRGYIERQEVRLGADAEAPLVADSVVQSTLKQIMDAERERLAKLPVDK